MWNNPGGDGSDSAEGVRRRCMKNSPSVLSYIGKRQEKAVTVAAKSAQFTTDETGKVQFLRRNRRNLAREGVVRKISSPQRLASVSNLCNGRCQWAGNICNGECCSGFGKRVCPFILGKSSMTGNPLGSLELYGRRGSQKDSKYPRRAFSWRNAEGKGRLGIGKKKGLLILAWFYMGVTPF